MPTRWIAVASMITIACAPRHRAPPHAAAAMASDPCSQGSLAIGGDTVWVDRQGAGAVTVVFESGFGNDSSVWTELAASTRARGARTLVYDRAGMGHSTIDAAAPYSLQHDVANFAAVLDRCQVAQPIVLVAHSYGGAIALMAAARDPRVRAVVLLDAMAPGMWSRDELDHDLIEMRSQYAEIRAEAPALARVAIPWAEALPVTVAELDQLVVPAHLPIIDIVAEHSQPDEQRTRTWIANHRDFAARDPARQFVLAAGSSHKVMRDRPTLVADAIARSVAIAAAAAPR